MQELKVLVNLLNVDLFPEQHYNYLGNLFQEKEDGFGIQYFPKSDAKYVGYFRNGKRIDFCLLVIGNFGGFPSITLPNGFVNNMPIAINITGRQFEDGLTLNIANKIEEELGYKGQVKEEYDV